LSTYHELTPGERYELSALRQQGLRPAEIARALGRHRSTIGREIRRNTRKDSGYGPSTTDQMTRGRRSRSRRNQRFDAAAWALVETWIREDLSPEQVSGWLRRFRLLSISHASSDSTPPNAPASLNSPRPTVATSPISSTTDLAVGSALEPPPSVISNNCSLSCCCASYLMSRRSATHCSPRSSSIGYMLPRARPLDPSLVIRVSFAPGAGGTPLAARVYGPASACATMFKGFARCPTRFSSSTR
jgi:hypothetical protein